MDSVQDSHRSPNGPLQLDKTQRRSSSARLTAKEPDEGYGEGMRHAFLIMAHSNWEQLRILLTLLDDSRNDIFLHIDKKATDFPRDDFTSLLKHATLHFTPRMDVTWGGDSQISCEMLLLKQAIPSQCDYYHLLSGADLPLHSMDYIDSFFIAHQGQEFLSLEEAAASVSQATRERISLYHPLQNLLGRRFFKVTNGCNALQRALHINRLRSHQNLVLGKGANWFSITDDFAKYVVENWHHWASVFSSSFCGDEIFLQTIILNSPFAERVYHYDSTTRSSRSAYMRLIDWKRGTPYVFRTTDYKELSISPMLFARKFDERVDPEIINKVVDHVKSERFR